LRGVWETVRVRVSLAAPDSDNPNLFFAMIEGSDYLYASMDTKIHIIEIDLHTIKLKH